MFLYELALHMGVRSTDLVARARELGMDVEQSSVLDQAQVAHLWSSFQQAPNPPQPLPAQPTPPDVPQFVAPAAWSPTPGAPGAAPATPPHAWGASGEPAAEADPDRDRTRPAVVVAAVAALVLLAGVLVFLSGGSDDDGFRADASATDEAGATPRSTTTSVPTTEAKATVPTEPVDPDMSVEKLTAMVRDRHRFCSGARGIFEMEHALSQPFYEGDLEGVASAIRANRDSWETAVEDLEAGTSSVLQNDVATYAASYRTLFAGIFEAEVGSAPSLAEFERTRASVALSAGRINAAMFDLCA
ncbi:MAG: translation initiation factor IF-2 N-terminal domain-containing protein [Actinobacteria bacterium]|nr:translation initiation factor IF-2 N-terminal domain-containing protein [Actinomycetota bacterium]